jgi:hypothetical protein
MDAMHHAVGKLVEAAFLGEPVSAVRTVPTSRRVDGNWAVPS